MKEGPVDAVTVERASQRERQEVLERKCDGITRGAGGLTIGQEVGASAWGRGHSIDPSDHREPRKGFSRLAKHFCRINARGAIRGQPAGHDPDCHQRRGGTDESAPVAGFDTVEQRRDECRRR
jgi:hypothetical protein